jgi:hypothetical protein
MGKFREKLRWKKEPDERNNLSDDQTRLSRPRVNVNVDPVSPERRCPPSSNNIHRYPLACQIRTLLRVFNRSGSYHILFGQRFRQIKHMPCISAYRERDKIHIQIYIYSRARTLKLHRGIIDGFTGKTRIFALWFFAQYCRARTVFVLPQPSRKWFDDNRAR